MSDSPPDPRRFSRQVFEGPERAPTRALLRAVGYTDEDFSRPVVGVVHCWTGSMPCNINHRELAAEVMAGVRAAGGTPMELNTIAVSDGIPMGTEGMRASLISREVIADSIEVAVRGHMFDAVVLIGGCDKTLPAAAMALARLDLPGLVVYSGTIAPGRLDGRALTLPDVYEGVGAVAAGRMTPQELHRLECHACPGAGACGGQYTANTMAFVVELLGISPLGASSPPAESPDKRERCRAAGATVMELLVAGTAPSRLLVPEAFVDAVTGIAGTGGSTNAVLHLLAIAHEAGVAFSLDDVERVSRRTPVITDLKPSGRLTAYDLFAAGGTPLVARRLLEAGLLHPDRPTCRGGTLGEVLARVPAQAGEVVTTVDAPVKPAGSLMVLRGSLAPETGLVKVAGHDVRRHDGPARSAGPPSCPGPARTPPSSPRTSRACRDRRAGPRSG